jgi:hypothetical protein
MKRVSCGLKVGFMDCVAFAAGFAAQPLSGVFVKE